MEFHKGYGNLTIHDILWNYRERHEGSLNARAGIIGDFWGGNTGGSQKVIDDYTVDIDTGEPWLRERAFQFTRHLGGVSTTIVSMYQTRQIFEDAGGNWDDRYSEPGVVTGEYEAAAKEASKNISATGPWEIDSHDSGRAWEVPGRGKPLAPDSVFRGIQYVVNSGGSNQGSRFCDRRPGHYGDGL